MEEVLKITNVSKSFGKIKAVNNISFKVKKGEMFAYLGVNGAGKSTTISMICGTLKNDSGSIIVCGEDINKNSKYIKNKIGVVFQNSVLDQTLSVYDNLKYRASLYDIIGEKFKKRFEELANMFELTEIQNQKVKTLSGGQRRRVDIARAIIHEPEIVFADEPTGNVDEENELMIMKLFRKIADENKIVVIVTHSEKVKQFADKVYHMVDGRLEE